MATTLHRVSGSPGVPDADLPSLGCGLGTSMFAALPPDDSDVPQDGKPPAVRATSSLHSQMRGPASSERLHNFLKVTQQEVPEKGPCPHRRGGRSMGALERLLRAVSPLPQHCPRHTAAA